MRKQRPKAKIKEGSASSILSNSIEEPSKACRGVGSWEEGGRSLKPSEKGKRRTATFKETKTGRGRVHARFLSSSSGV